MDSSILYFRIFLDKRENGIVQPNGSVGTHNSSDFYINMPITRKYKRFDDYVNIDKDPFKTKIERQNINPLFLELAFFETIKSISGGTPEESIEQKSHAFNIIINK